MKKILLFILIPTLLLAKDIKDDKTEVVNGIISYKSNKKPVTGVVVREVTDNNGDKFTIKHEVVDGVWHGKYEVYNVTKKCMQVESTYKDGKENGLRTVYRNDDGTVVYMIELEDGIDVYSRVLNSDGSLSRELFYDEGRLILTKDYEYGVLVTEVEVFEEGKDYLERYYIGGKTVNEMHEYENGDLVASFYYEDDLLLKMVEFDDGDYFVEYVREYRKDQTISLEYIFVDGELSEGFCNHSNGTVRALRPVEIQRIYDGKMIRCE